MTPRIQKAIDILLDAIINGTLAKGTCAACAVGNLVAAGCGRIIRKFDTMTFRQINKKSKRIESPRWGSLFLTNILNSQTKYYLAYPELLQEEDIMKEINSTDFTVDELAAIEYAFETNTKILFTDYHFHTAKEIRADQIKGLEAVVKVMLEFDEQKDDVKEVFTSHAEAICV